MALKKRFVRYQTSTKLPSIFTLVPHRKASKGEVFYESADGSPQLQQNKMASHSPVSPLHVSNAYPRQGIS